MHKKKFVVNKAALIFVMVSSFMVGFIFGDTNKSGGFFSTELFIRAIIIAIIGGSIVAFVSFLQYKKSDSNNSKQ